MHDGIVTPQSAAPRVGAVVVFFNPDAACIERANRLASKVSCVVVVDNTPSLRTADSLGLSDDIRYLPNGANVGIATALNLGIEALRFEGMDLALLFDQDSNPSDTVLVELPAVVAKANDAGDRVALVGPAYDDPRLGGVAPFVRFRHWRLERVVPAGQEPIDVDFLITSGSCINLRYWSAVGPMDDALFIDFVDLEWCVRAKQKGYRVLGVPWIRMSHELGGEPVRIFGRPYPMHGPIRHYYQFRNVVALIKRSYMPWSWKTTELVKLPVRLVVYALFPAQRAQHIKMALQGLRDGWIGQLGPR